MQACHDAINDGQGLVHQWRVTQLTRLGIPGPLAQAEADRVGWHQIAGLVQGRVLRGWCGGWPSMLSVSPDALGQVLVHGGGQHVRVRYLGHVRGRGAMMGNVSCGPFTGDHTWPSPRLPPSPNSKHRIGTYEKDGALVTIPAGIDVNALPTPTTGD